MRGKTVTDFVEPLGGRILIRKDEARQTTRGGIVLPDKAEIPTIYARKAWTASAIGAALLLGGAIAAFLSG